jgi:hypothetical protein
MTERFKRGIIQSRGLGDIIIALPIARHYFDRGEDIIWPICEEFMGSLVTSVPWVRWIPIKTDDQGLFFLDHPVQVLRDLGVDLDESLYLYHYLNTMPEQTDPELFNILKFDQYKYWVAGVPFRDKWTLKDCIVRDPAREDALRARLKLPKRYCITHLTGSSFKVDVAVTWLDPAVEIIRLEDHQTDNVFDWISVLEGAEALVCVDSVIANMVDQLSIEGPDLYWIRRSPWDLTPVLGSSWTIVPTNLPIAEPTRVDPAVAAEAKLSAARARAAQAAGGVTSHVPFQTDPSKVPTSFMHALKK